MKRVFVHVQQNNNSYGELDGSVRVGGKTFFGLLCWVYRIRKGESEITNQDLVAIRAIDLNN